MRKVLKPANLFPRKLYNSPVALRQNLQNQIFNSRKINESLKLLNIVNSETRVQILFVLTKQNFLCVSDIADILRLSISAVSHQLRVLREYKLVQSHRKQKVVYYSLGTNLPNLILLFLREASI